jgi:uncharacterized membrane protein (UPF0127 family)
MMFRAPLWLALLPTMLLPAGSAQALESIEACFMAGESQGKSITLEVAKVRADRQKGLMERTHLPSDHGMLFIYPSMRSPQKGFWMYNTRIPLDIAYLDASSRIVNIRSMPPCESEERSGCPVYPAGVPFQYAVEMNAGFFERWQLGTGTELVWKNQMPQNCPLGQSNF